MQFYFFVSQFIHTESIPFDTLCTQKTTENKGLLYRGVHIILDFCCCQRSVVNAQIINGAVVTLTVRAINANSKAIAPGLNAAGFSN